MGSRPRPSYLPFKRPRAGQSSFFLFSLVGCRSYRPHPVRYALQSLAIGWGASPTHGAVCCLALASQFRVGVEPGPFRVTGFKASDFASPPSCLTLRLAGRVTPASVAIDL